MVYSDVKKFGLHNIYRTKKSTVLKRIRELLVAQYKTIKSLYNLFWNILKPKILILL